MQPGNKEQLPVRILASRANSHTARHHGAKGSSNCSLCVVMYLGQCARSGGIRGWPPTAVFTLAASLLSPQTL